VRAAARPAASRGLACRRMSLDLDAFLPIPRLAGLRLSPDGDRLLFTAGTLTPKGTAFGTAVWSLDTDGLSSARRLTAPRENDALVGVLPDGSALLVSGRPDPEAPADADDEDSGLWLLPRAGGEPRRLLSLATAPRAVGVARAAATMALLCDVFPRSATLADDRALATRRKDAGTGALLFDDYPIRFWDRHLGPRRPRLLALPPPEKSAERGNEVLAAEPVDLTGAVGQSLVEAGMSMVDDGSAVVTTWRTPLGLGAHRTDLVLIPAAGGERRVIAAVDDHDHDAPAVSPDGRWVVATRNHTPRPDRAPAFELWLYPLEAGAGNEPRRLAADLDRWPGTPLWSPDGSTVYVTADDEGFGAIYAVDVAGGPTRRVSADGALSDVSVSPDGATLYALRSRIATPPEVVSLAAAGTDGAACVLYAAALPRPVEQRVEQVHATGQDGTPLRAWLVLPEPAEPAEPAELAESTAGAPAPLLVTIHGGPLGSWNAWQWRWQPALFTARGYAVLLPDPALSTGYGQQMVDRGWHQWGGTPYTDVMALTDAAVAHPDIDGERTAVIGGSYGGYLTNWVIGHTDRFRAAVTHASLWSMGQFHGTTDDAVYWEQDWGDPRRDHEHYARWSPDSFVDTVRTPTLVIHGENDYRVPVSEGLRLWTDLQRRGVPSQQLLYLPDENHWVLKPGNIRVWYGAVLAWLDAHVLQQPYERPELA